MLAADPESLKGLSLTGVLSQGLANCLMGFCGSADELAHFPDHEDYERISDVLRAGPKVVRHRKAMGRRVGSNGWLSCNRAVWSGASRYPRRRTRPPVRWAMAGMSSICRQAGDALNT